MSYYSMNRHTFYEFTTIYPIIYYSSSFSLHYVTLGVNHIIPFHHVRLYMIWCTNVHDVDELMLGYEGSYIPIVHMFIGSSMFKGTNIWAYTFECIGVHLFKLKFPCCYARLWPNMVWLCTTSWNSISSYPWPYFPTYSTLNQHLKIHDSNQEW